MFVRPSGSVCLSDVELDCLDSNMPKYQPLTAEIQVPKEWPVEAARSVIVDVVKMAINRRLSGDTVIVTIGRVSALVVANVTHTRYLLERTEDTDDDEAHKFELHIPEKVMLITLAPNGRLHDRMEPVPKLDLELSFEHPVSTMFVTNSRRRQVVTAVPNIETALNSKGIPPPYITEYALKVTYRVRKGGWLDDLDSEQERESLVLAGPSVFAKQVTDSEWEVFCLERTMPLRSRRRVENYKAVFHWILLLGVFVVIMVFGNKRNIEL